MTVQIIPGIKTSYADGNVGRIAPSLANVEIKIGAAASGTPGRIYTLSGASAKKDAKTIFGSGPLLKAIEEAFDAGSSKIYALRAGTPGRGSLALPNTAGVNALRLKGNYNLAANSHYANVQETINSITTAFAVAIDGAVKRVKYYSSAYAAGTNVPLDAAVASVCGVAVAPIMEQLGGNSGFYVCGLTAGGDTKIWHYSSAGVLVSEDTADISSLLEEGETVTGMESGFFAGQFAVTSATRMFKLDISEPGSPEQTGIIDYADDLSIADPDISGIAGWSDLTAAILGVGDGSEKFVVVDKTAKKLYRISITGAGVASHDKTIDFSSLVGGSSVVEGATFTGGLITTAVLLERRTAATAKLVPITIDWSAQTATAGTAHEVEQDACDLGGYIADANITTTLTVQNRNDSPVTSKVYEATGTMSTVTGLLSASVTAGGVYEVDELALTLPLMPSLTGGTGAPDPTYFSQFSGGSNAESPTNGEFIAALALTTGKKDAAWLHVVGATSLTLWTAILTHCSDMLETYNAERFAILECPAFSSAYEEGSAGYLADLETYVEAVQTLMASVADRNAVVVPGGATFVNSDGDEYDNSLAASFGGLMASLAVQKSTVNKRLPNALALVPEFLPGHLEALIQARTNPCMFVEGRGIVFAECLTGAAAGSDYANLNDLRAVYYGCKAAREAGQIMVGEENDSEGIGLRTLENKMSAPLKDMLDHGQIDEFEVSAVSTAEDRILGDVYVSVGVKPRRAIKHIYNDVYIK